MESTNWDEQLRQLDNSLLAMASVAAEAIISSITALRHKDEKAALTLLKSNTRIKSGCFDVRNSALAVLAAQRPDGHDLRLLMSFPDVCLELGRIGQYAQAIAELAAFRDQPGMLTLFTELQYMAGYVSNRIQYAAQAFVKQDLKGATIIMTQDILIEALYNQIYCNGLDQIAAEPASTERVRLILTAAHNLKCVAYHAMHICERAIFVVTGELTQGPQLEPVGLLVQAQ